jgi:hypothetical protein
LEHQRKDAELTGAGRAAGPFTYSNIQ